ncbi:MAG: NAD(P)/FAD-dependent oxidoreductase [Bryobacterales bacterium]|nr:NAD(P)/FAD-dependent oxidoreductase [Acidobacteriota bacterium]MCB9385244.1 NAD(P)/FAD-dependent oxidoreductase [Bryobacterales bacterium]
MDQAPVIVLGAGPAGLTAAYELTKAGVESIVLERDDVVGGIARTVEYKGYRFDIGGHRFFTKVKPVEDLWHELLGDEMIRRPRMSRIFYKGSFFAYPLKPFNALRGLGLWETMRCGFSYVKARIAPVRPEDNFSAWVSNRFGRRLFEIFFKTYTEKVWGIPCDEIQAEWAAQRIKGLSLLTAVKNAIFGERASSRGEVIKTLIDEFEYPRLGPGMMWERARDLIEKAGSRVVMEAPVERVEWTVDGIQAVYAGGRRYEGDAFVSSIALRDLVEAMDPPPPAEVLAAARKLRYRDFLTVALIVDAPDLFPDTWIYIHEPHVKLGRVQNFKNWSPDMTPDPSKTCLGLEYFCFEGDPLWNASDEELIALGKREIETLGLTEGAPILDGSVVRMPKAYPVYDSEYPAALRTVRAFLGTLPNLQLTGRNGMHRYNNQDHSMLTAMLAVRNLLGARHDLWQVNVDQEYHEEGREVTLEDLRAAEGTQPLVPNRIDR